MNGLVLSGVENFSHLSAGSIVIEVVSMPYFTGAEI